ncbi:MAG: pyridoxamine 5'-phosphate oxidase family protein, partial [Bacteroidota bacterium]
MEYQGWNSSRIFKTNLSVMMLSSEVKQYIDQSVLCWLATTAMDHMPNVSHKEFFTFFDDEHLFIANMAS